MTDSAPGADERRARHYMRRAVGGAEAGERRVITPTRIISPGPAPLPDGPPGPDDLPPWWSVRPGPPAPPPPPPPTAVPAPAAPPPEPIEIRLTLVPAEVPPEPSAWARAWAWLTGLAGPGRLVLGLVLPLVPIPTVGYSAAAVWADWVDDVRAVQGPAVAYAVGLVTLTAAFRALKGTRAARWVAVSVTALVGLVFGALDLYDLVTITTGVTR